MNILLIITFALCIGVHGEGDCEWDGQCCTNDGQCGIHAPFLVCVDGDCYDSRASDYRCDGDQDNCPTDKYCDDDNECTDFKELDAACEEDYECGNGGGNCCWSKCHVGICYEPKPPPCLSENDKIVRENGKTALLKDVEIGDYIFDGNSFTKVLTVEYGQLMSMLRLHLSNSTDQTTVTLTGSHLLYDLENQLKPASDIKIGDIIYENWVVDKIESGIKQYSSSPITFSGYLQVNGGVKVSSYVRNKELAFLVHNYFGIFRWISENINEYMTGKVLEWIVTDHHSYYHMMNDGFWETSFNFHLFSPFVIALILIQRLYFPIIIGGIMVAAVIKIKI